MNRILARYIVVVILIIAASLGSIMYYSSNLYHGDVNATPQKLPQGIGYVGVVILGLFIGLKYFIYDHIAHLIVGKRKNRRALVVLYTGFGLTLAADGWFIYNSAAPIPDAGFIILSTLIFSPIILVISLVALVVIRRKSTQAATS